jgi:hypothetical protein
VKIQAKQEISPMLSLPRRKAEVLHQSLDHWREAGLLSAADAARLGGDIRVLPFDWRRLARYAFWVAMACLVTAFVSVFADARIVEWIKRLFSFGPAQRCLGLAVLASGLFGYAVFRLRRRPLTGFRNEAILFLGVLATAGSVANLGLWLDTGSGRYDLLLLVACAVYAAVALAARSVLVWVFAVLSFGGWMGAHTGYASGWGSYYLGMNWPLRFVLLGGVLIALAQAFRRLPHLVFLERSTQSLGLLYLFVSLWLLSIFGDYGNADSWRRVKQIELLHWSLLFAAAAGAAIWLGLRRDDAMLRGYGLVFLGINLYTRFFEMFWDSLHKGAFFAVLGVSLWLLGRRAETLWRLGQPPKATLGD